MWPITARFNNYELGTYGVFLAIAVLCGLWVARHLAARDGLVAKRVNDVGLGTLVAALLGAKGLGLLVALAGGLTLDWSEVRTAGAIHGGIFGAMMGGTLLARLYRLPLPLLTDAFVPATALGQALGRLGCFSAGCCFGTPSHQPWALSFVHQRAAELGGVPLHVGLHPVQLYDAALHFLLFALLFLLHKKKLLVGRLLGPWLVLEGCTRLLVENFRGDLGRGIWFDLSWLSTGRLTSISMILLGLVALALMTTTSRIAKSEGSKTST